MEPFITSFNGEDIPNIKADQLLDEYQVCVVGCGPNGLVLANLLGQLGISTIIIESNQSIITAPRAAHLDDEGLRVLQKIGLDKIIKDNSFELGVKFNRISHIKSFLSIPNKNTDICQPRSIFWYQPQFEKLLADGVFTRYGDHVKLLLNHRVVEYNYNNVDNRNTVVIQQTKESNSNSNIDEHPDEASINSNKGGGGPKYQFKCQYIIGADGGNSWVRKSMGSKFIGESGKKRWLVVDVQLHAGHHKMENYFQFVCDPSAPMITLPIPCGHYRWEFVIDSDDPPSKIEELDNVHKMLSEYGADIDQLTVVRKSVYVFHNRTADQWFDGTSVFIIGDAAHCLPPFLGMGVSSGVRDSINLVWKIDMALRGVGDPTKLFHSYMAERLPEVNLIGKKSSMIGQAIMSTNKVVSFLRDLFINILLFFPFIQTIFANDEMKPVSPITVDNGIIDTRPPSKSTHKKLRPLSPNSTLFTFISRIILLIFYFILFLVQSVQSPFGRKPRYQHRIGHRIAQPNVYQSPSNQLIPLNDIMGLGFTCIVLSSSSSTSCDTILSQLDINHSVWKLMRTEFIEVLPFNSEGNTSSSSSIQQCRIQDDLLYKFIGTDSKVDTVVLVRPDRQIYGVYQSSDDISSLSSHLHSLFI